MSGGTRCVCGRPAAGLVSPGSRLTRPSGARQQNCPLTAPSSRAEHFPHPCAKHAALQAPGPIPPHTRPAPPVQVLTLHRTPTACRTRFLGPLAPVLLSSKGRPGVWSVRPTDHGHTVGTPGWGAACTPASIS